MQSTPWKIVWSDALSMSNPEIDAEHQHFAALVNELNDAILDQRDKAEIERIMHLIMKDAVAHFAHEERLFLEKHYPQAQEHTQIHASLIDSLRHALQRIQQSEFGLEWIEMGLAIKNQLVAHLLNEDTLYIDYLRTE